MRIRLSTCFQVAIFLLAVWLAVAAQRDPSDIPAPRDRALGATPDKQGVVSSGVDYDVAR
ncbi:hypothetical protein GGQ82_004240 [Sphingobium olei]|jgi:hypothetical protein